MDALAQKTEEGRRRQRNVSGSRLAGFDPELSEWGNPAGVMSSHQLVKFSNQLDGYLVK